MMDGYNLIRKDRSFGRGGGVLLYVCDKFKYDVIETSCDIEQLFVKVVYNRCSFVVGVVYKPPQTSYFIDSLETSLAMSYADNIFCIGDVNVNFLNKDCVGTNYFNSMLSSLEMNQMITQATHISSTSESLIDVLICSNESLVTSVFVHRSQFSMHECIGCYFKCDKPKTESKFFTFRDFSKFDDSDFRNDLANCNLEEIFLIHDIDSKIATFNRILLNVLN
nr:unnamed protein product [Callosobruchus chinensis]